MALQLPAQAEIIAVRLDKIDGGSHGPFSMSYAFDPGPLILSIKNAGLINPPILREDEQGKLDIVAGYRRVEALKSLAWEVEAEMTG